MRGPCLFALSLVLAALPSPGHAQWSSDPAVNLSVADGIGSEVQAKVAPTADGGGWISWFDGGGGYDVRVQKLDSTGNEVLAHGGMLVADRAFSSTQDYGLDTDASGNALLVFRDDRQSGVQITATLVTPAGGMPWGATGVQLTSTTAFVAAPKIAGTSDGGAVIAWTEDASARVQKLDASGAPQWGAGLTLTPAMGSYSPSDLHDAGSDAILAFVHQTGSFGSPRHLLAQKYDASGTALWGAGHVAVFDGGSLQFGNFPEFVPDGSGGAVFSWYDTAGATLQCYAQRVNAAGTEVFAHNGVAVSTNVVRVRVSPWAALDPGTGDTYVFWKEQNSLQSQSGVYGQKLDSGGSRQWGSEGAVVVAVGASDRNNVRHLPGGGAFVFWTTAPSFGQDVIRAAHVNAAGTTDIAVFDVASTASSKSRLDVERSTAGFALLAWSDDRSGSDDILAQNVNVDGSLGLSGLAAPLPSESALTLASPWPNPTRGPVSVSFALRGPREYVLDVIDVQGRVVRRLGRGSAVQSGVESWDGRDDAGRPVAGGVYFLRLGSSGETVRGKVVVVR